MEAPQEVTRLVLLVEDDADDRKLYGDLLWYNGFDVIHASSAEQGFWIAHEGEPDLIILDLNLPDEDGLALCRRFKKSRATAKIPILVLSARDEEPSGRLALEAGCARFLQKPRKPLDVLREVIALIGRAPPGAPLPGRVSAE